MRSRVHRVFARYQNLWKRLELAFPGLRAKRYFVKF
mgnify:FL=1